MSLSMRGFGKKKTQKPMKGGIIVRMKIHHRPNKFFPRISATIPVPRFYGVIYFDHARRELVCTFIPLNVFLGVALRVFLCLRVPPTARMWGEAYIAGEQAGFNAFIHTATSGHKKGLDLDD